jgi:hypothetical protein
VGNLNGLAGLTAAASANARGRAIGSAFARLTGATSAGASGLGGVKGTAALTGSVSAGASGLASLGSVLSMLAAGHGGASGAGAVNMFAALVAECRAGASAAGLMANLASLQAAGSGGAAGSGQSASFAALIAAARAGASGSGAASAVAAAAKGCIERIIDAVRTRFDVEVATVQGVATLNDNEPIEVTDASDLFIRLAVSVAAADQLHLLDPSDHRYIGEVRARIFLKVNLGDAAAWQLADAINAAFRGVTADEVVYDPPPSASVRGRNGDRWEIDVTVPFYALCDEMALA